MATNKSVVVLAPNGRRQTVKVTPNTIILQIIEEVCKKQGYDPKDYDIKHHRKVLDTSCSIRFSGLPNNAQLELVAAQKTRSEGSVIIGLQLESGERLMGEFQPSNSIMDILKELCPDQAKPEKNPVVIYTRREIYGTQALEDTTIRSLGLTSGRAIFRLIHRSPEELKTQANVSAPLPTLPKTPTEEPYAKKRNISEFSPQGSERRETVHAEENENKMEKPVTRETRPQPLPLPKAEEKLKPNANRDIVQLVKQEKEKRNAVINSKRSENSESPTRENARKISDSPSSTNKRNISDDMDVKAGVSGNNSGGEEDFVFLGDRNAIAFSPEMAKAVRTEDLPDDFFELTIDDAKKLIKDIKKTRMELENKHLQTKAMRELKESKRQLSTLHKYKKTIIRIVFPDHTVLQGTFNPTESIAQVIEFVREYLEDKSIQFYLYTAPPKQILKKESMLIDAGCVPSTIVYFGTDSPRQDGKYLKSTVLSRLMSPSIASTATERMRKESRRVLPQEDKLSESTSSEDIVSFGPSTSTDIRNYEDYPPRSPKPHQKTPKWFKLPK